MRQLPEQQGPDRGLGLVKKVSCYLGPTMQGEPPAALLLQQPVACRRQYNGGDVKLWGRGKQQQAFAIWGDSALPRLWLPQ